MSKIDLSLSEALAPGHSRRNFLRFTGAFGAAVAVTTAVGACSGGPKSSTTVGTKSEDPNAPKTFDVAIGYNNNSSWDPLNTGSAFAMAAHNHIYEPLWDAEAVTRKPFAALATELPKDTKAMEWTVKLREGATWHDGKPVTADDVVYSFGRVLNAEKKVLTNAFFALWLDSVTKVDDKTVLIKLKLPFTSALQRFSIVKIMPKHVFDGQPDDFFKGGKNAVGSGPFKVESHEDTSFTKFVKHDGYNGPIKLNVDSMQWNVSVDAAARVGLLTSGANAVQISDNIPQDAIDSLKAKGLTVEGVDSMNLLGLVFNTSKAPFQDKRVRQALRYAIDSKKMIDVAIAGQGTPATGFLHKENPDYAKAKVVYDYDPAKAKGLLAEAGVGTISIRLLSTNISWVRTAVNTIKEGWDAIGINTTLDVQETAAFNTKVAAGDDADVITFSGNPNQFGTDGDLNIRWYYSDSNVFLPWNKWNATPEWAALRAQLDAALAEDDQAKHKTLLDAAMNTIADEAVAYPVIHMKLFTAWDPKKIGEVKPLDIPGVNLLNAKRLS